MLVIALARIKAALLYLQDMSLVINQLSETVAYIRARFNAAPGIGIILGSGLGDFINNINVEMSFDYRHLPHFPVATVEGHPGKLVFGELKGKKVVVMAGRFHYYEGYPAAEVVYPVRVLSMLGIKTLLISNAAGGVNPAFGVGDLMIIRDHISLAVVNPLIGPNEDKLGPRFPDMSEPYSRSLIALGREAAGELNIPVHEGVYYGVTGPSFETHAEYRMIRLLGADAVGMSTVQEVIVAAHMGLPVFGISVIADLGVRDDDSVISHREVLEVSQRSGPRLTALLTKLIGKL